MPDGRFIGILLAAGKGSRFDPSGQTNKLLQTMPDGSRIVECAARHLGAAVQPVLAVVSPEDPATEALLKRAACEVTACPNAAQGMSASLSHAIRIAADAAGWIIALGDMPFIRPDTIRAVLAALESGADIALPSCRGRYGHPVGFSRRHYAGLMALAGDKGARCLLDRHPVREIAVDDAGILRDVDTASDLRGKFFEA